MSKLMQELGELEKLIEVEYNKEKDKNTILELINKEQENNLKNMDKLLFDTMSKNNNLIKENNRLKYHIKIGQFIFATYILSTSAIYFFNIMFL